MGKNVKRLYATFQPNHYAIDLAPNRESSTFTGSVSIDGYKRYRPNKRLTFHQNGLKITAATITKHDKRGVETIAVSRINHHAGFDEVRLHTDQMLYPGNYTIKLEFTGAITKQMNGIYPCFFDDNGTEKQLIATQFESHHAREVFPCIDEPEAKATFDLALTSPEGEAVIANTPVASQAQLTSDSNASLVKTTFETTPVMSTYLLAFVYGELGYKEATTHDGIVVRAYATPANTDFTDFALDVAVKCLEFYNNYFDIPYPLKKCDLIALPDFASGAMENWGCITFREQCMLVDPANSTLATKQYVAMVVAHELAHQWFGNLVTMRWWTDLWLNEGFASWIEYLAVDHLFPEWQMWTQFNVDEQQRALKLDALEHTHPVEVPVHHPDEIRTIFDTISYSKGASVIHMLHQYLGPDIFRDGLRHYLNRHKYSNTDTVDLWQALEEISGKPVKQFMESWTNLPGFPLISVNINDEGVELTQERFYLNPQHANLPAQTWPIATLANSQNIPGLLSNTQETIKAGDFSELKLNRNQSGFYRVAYDSSHLQRLSKLIVKGSLEPQDRLGILSDIFETAKAGKATTTDALNFLQVYAQEDNNAVWDVIAMSIGAVRGVMDDEDLRESMKPYIRALTSVQLKRLGWKQVPNEPYFDKLLRPTILGLASASDEKTVVSESLKRFKSMKTPEDVDPDLRGLVYGTAVRHGDESTFEKLFGFHEKSALSEERTSLAGALCGFKQPELVKRALGLIMTPSVRTQDVSYWVAYSFMNRFARDETWQWMQDNWLWLDANLGTDLSFYRFPMYAANAFSTPEFLDQYKEFFLPRRAPAFDRAIDQGIEVLQWQSAWKQRDLKDIKTFFKKHQPDAASKF